MGSIRLLYIASVNFHSGGTSQHFHGDDQAEHILLPHEKPFDTLQGSKLNPHPVTTFQQRMRLGAKGAFDHLANSRDLGLGNCRRTTSPPPDPASSRGASGL